MRAFAYLTAAVLLVIGIGVGIGVLAQSNGSSHPGLTPALFQAVNGRGSSWHITPAPSDVRVPVTKGQAIAMAIKGGARVVGAGLVRWSDDYPRHSPFVWAIFTDPPGRHVTVGAVYVPPGSKISGGIARPITYYVTFVDGETGHWLASGDGTDPHLPPLPVFSG